VLWFTGLSGAGKSTIANLVEKKLHAMGRHTYLLDGDNVRHGLNKDLGFTDADRVENIRRVAEVARLMVDAGLIVLTAFISPFRAERAWRARCWPKASSSRSTSTRRWPWPSARREGPVQEGARGELKNFTGIDSPYEAPEKQLHAVGQRLRSSAPERFKGLQPPLTVLAGALLGFLVTLTSVGAGALGTVMLVYLYPFRMTPNRLVGTDIVHAIPLTMVAGMGHLWMGNVDLPLLGQLLLGSIPGIVIGSLVGTRTSELFLRRAIAAVLVLVGAKLLLA
jgi:adenylyl-sulfate kinase